MVPEGPPKGGAAVGRLSYARLHRPWRGGSSSYELEVHRNRPGPALILDLSLPPAAPDLVLINRSLFPERPWVPLTGADGALAGAGRATDPASSWTRNPSL